MLPKAANGSAMWQSKWKSKIVRRMLSAIKQLDGWQNRARYKTMLFALNRPIRRRKMNWRSLVNRATQWRQFISLNLLNERDRETVPDEPKPSHHISPLSNATHANNSTLFATHGISSARFSPSVHFTSRHFIHFSNPTRNYDNAP